MPANESFEILRRWIKKHTGIILDANKNYLIEQRMGFVVETLKLKSIDELANSLQMLPQQKLKELMVDAITTNETYFFRDIHPFQAFQITLLPQLIEQVKQRKVVPCPRKGSKVSILSAGASSGQEAYSIAINICEALRGVQGVTSTDFNIVAGDISAQILEQAIKGEYTEFEVNRGLSAGLKTVYFENTGTKWRVKDNLRHIVQFRQVNFTENFGYLGGFDCIFCRNILIYFEQADKEKIIKQFHSLLPVGGALILGASENLYGLYDLFDSKMIQGSLIYFKK